MGNLQLVLCQDDYAAVVAAVRWPSDAPQGESRISPSRYSHPASDVLPLWEREPLPAGRYTLLDLISRPFAVSRKRLR